ncbi:peptide ABC transporter substrate-binding protein, partial [Oceanithermus sp.]
MVVGAKEEPVLLGDFWGFAGNTASASDVENYLWAALEYTDIDGNDQPYLATEVPTTKNGRVIVTDLGKGKKRIDIHYTLRDGIYWSDGVPITSEDVRFFYEVGKYPGAPVANPDYWQRVSLKVQDERNFTVSFEPAYFYDLIGPAIGLAPAHTMRPAWEKAKKALSGLNSEKDAKKIAAVCRNFVLKTGSPQALNRGSLVYSGPFVLQKWAPGKLEMTRNPRFLITPPGGSGHYLKRVTYQFYEDRDALNVALISGRLDATTITALTLKEALSPQLTRRLQGRYQIWAVPGPIWEHLEVNKFTEVRQVRELLLDDPRTRQALLYAINRKGLTEAFFDGLQPMADTWVNPQNPAYDSEVRRYPYDPEKARQLLTSLGWSDLDGDGYLERRNNDGRIVSFVLEYTTTSDNQERLRIQDFVRSNLEKVGIKVSVVNVPSTVAFSQEFLPRAASGRWRGLFEFSWLLDLGDEASLYTCHDTKSGKILLPEKSNGYIGY